MSVLCPVSFIIFGVSKVMLGVYKSESVVTEMEGRVRVKWALSSVLGSDGEGGDAYDGEGMGMNEILLQRSKSFGFTVDVITLSSRMSKSAGP